MTTKKPYNLICLDGHKYRAKNASKVGSGGNSVVLEVEELPDCVAKIFESESNSQLRKKRFKYESDVIKKLSKGDLLIAPTIIATGLIDGKDGHPFFIMKKYQSFKDFRLSLEERNLDYKLNLLIKICDKLILMHKKGIYHRDIKPDNILFDKNLNDEPLLCDFGLAISNDRDLSIKTRDDENLGSYTFRPPELIGHHENMKPSDYKWSDIYQFGKTAYALLKSSQKSFSDGCQIIDEDLEIDSYMSDLKIEHVYSMIEKAIVYNYQERIELEECKNELFKAIGTHPADYPELERKRFIRRIKGMISKTANSTVLTGTKLYALFPTLFLKENEITIEQPLREIDDNCFSISFYDASRQPSNQVDLDYAGGFVIVGVTNKRNGAIDTLNIIVSELFVKNNDIFISGFYKPNSANAYVQLVAKIDLQFKHTKEEIVNRINLTLKSSK